MSDILPRNLLLVSDRLCDRRSALLLVAVHVSRVGYADRHHRGTADDHAGWQVSTLFKSLLNRRWWFCNENRPVGPAQERVDLSPRQPAQPAIAPVRAHDN